jgi:hypothetical protein
VNGLPALEKHLMLMCKVQFNESELGYRTLGHLRSVNFLDQELFFNYISSRLSVLNDSYTTLPIKSISFSYIIKNGLASGERALLQELSDRTLSTHSFNTMTLPISMDPNDYGILISKSIMDGFTRFVITLNRKVFQIDVNVKGLTNRVRILGNIDLEWTDTKISNISTGDIFKR